MADIFPETLLLRRSGCPDVRVSGGARDLEADVVASAFIARNGLGDPH
ncbi:hypothetical protein EDD90_1538 [Streptomyces sp. Ag109_O5-1]|nr:hypothetical protein EDD90_1538 [Streptomyces sp. Ag109_O5-1]